jgi:hypothetical protein
VQAVDTRLSQREATREHAVETCCKACTEWNCVTIESVNFFHKSTQQTKSQTPIYKNEWKISETNQFPTTSAIWQVRTEHSRCKCMESVENLCHCNVFEMVTSSLIRRIQMGHLSRLRWLTGFFKCIIWGRFFVFAIPAVNLNSQNLSFVPDCPMTLLIGLLG